MANGKKCIFFFAAELRLKIAPLKSSCWRKTANMCGVGFVFVFVWSICGNLFHFQRLISVEQQSTVPNRH